MTEDILLQVLVPGVSGALIVLIFYLIKKFSDRGPKVVIGKKAGLILAGALFLTALFIVFYFS